MASKIFFCSGWFFFLFTPLLSIGQSFSAEDFFQKGRELHQSGKLIEAIGYYSEAIKSDDSHLKSMFNRGLAFMHQGKYRRAIDDFSSYLSLQGSDAEVLELRGNCFFMLQFHESALKDFDSAATIQPAPRLFCNKASVFLAYKEIALADLEIKKALEVDSFFNHAWALKGELAFQKRQYGQAIEFFEKALKLGISSEADLLLNLGGAYLGLGNYEKAIEVLNLSIELAPISKAFSNRALAFFKLGSLQKANEDAYSAIEIDISNSDAHTIFGLVEFQKKENEKALIFFNTALSWDSNHINARTGRGQVLHALKREDEALLDFDIVLADRDARLRSENWYIRALIRLSRRDLIGACEDFQMAQSLGLTSDINSSVFCH